MIAMAKRRLDQLLVDRNLAESREKARALILAGAVMVNGQKAGKAGHAVPDDCRIEVASRPPYVGRGGVKLAAALERFAIDVRGQVCLDVGASTGGFTDCLLQHGAARVHAVDTGAGQIDWKLRTDPRVMLHENTNARYLQPEDIGEPIEFAACDVSFISVTLILPVLPPLLTPGAPLVILVKPQFETGRKAVGKGGIVRDPAAHEAACHRVAACAEQLGFHTAVIDSPIPGGEGNKEFLLYATR